MPEAYRDWVALQTAAAPAGELPGLQIPPAGGTLGPQATNGTAGRARGRTPGRRSRARGLL